MRIDIVPCRYLSAHWEHLISQGYHTAFRDKDEPYIAVMWRGSGARDLVRNVPLAQWPQQFRKIVSAEG